MGLVCPVLVAAWQQIQATAKRSNERQPHLATTERNLTLALGLSGKGRDLKTLQPPETIGPHLIVTALNIPSIQPRDGNYFEQPCPRWSHEKGTVLSEHAGVHLCTDQRYPVG